MQFLKNTGHRPITIQLILVIPIFLLFSIFQFCIIPCNSVGYGILISLANIILATVINQLSLKIAQQSPKQGIALVFVFAGVRFVMIGVLFAIGIGVLALDAVTMLLAFVLLHVGGQIINLMLK